MKKSTFYSIVYIFILVLVSVFHACAQDSTFANDRSEVYSFYFAASSSTLHVEDMNTIDSLYKEGWVAVAAVGVANQLPNTRRSLTNDSLAVERALAIQDYVDHKLDWYNHSVMISSSELDRRVDVIFVKKNIVDTEDSKIEWEVADDYHTVGNTIVDSVETDLFFAEDTFPTIDSVLMDILINRMPLPNVGDSIEYDTISIGTVIKSEAFKSNEEEESSNDYCECTETNTQHLWEQYKQLQQDAQMVLHTHGLRSPEYKDILYECTQTRICWEFSRGVRRSKAKLQKHCEGYTGKTGLSSIKKKKKKGSAPFKCTKLGRKLKRIRDWWRFKVLDRYLPNRNC